MHSDGCENSLLLKILLGNPPQNSVIAKTLMSSRSLNEILIKISTELFDFIFAAYYFTSSCLFTCVREGTMYAEFKSVVLFTVLYSRFQHCAKDVSKVTILEYCFSTAEQKIK